MHCFAQGKNPKIMVVPMDTWCQERGFWNVYENQGEIKGAPNYEQAVQDSRELMLVISKSTLSCLIVVSLLRICHKQSRII